MKILIEESVLRQALEAFDVATTPLNRDRQEILAAKSALRTALDAAEKVEPVAYAVINGDRVAQLSVTQDPFYPHSTALYTHPAPAVPELGADKTGEV